MGIRLAIRVAGRSDAPLSWHSERPEVSVGRSSRADLQLPDGRISGLHLLIRHEPGQRWLVRDEGSLNGTRLNGRPLTDQEQPLGLGDELALGRLRLTVVSTEQPAARPVVAATVASDPCFADAASSDQLARWLAETADLPTPDAPGDPAARRYRRPLAGLHWTEGLLAAVGLAALGLLGWVMLG